MVTEIQYTNIRRVLDDLTEHPMLRDLTLEQVVKHTLRFISLHGFPKMYQDREATIEIEDFRGLLPCDLISIIQAEDMQSHQCMRSMTDSFTPGLSEEKPKYHRNPYLLHNIPKESNLYIPPKKEGMLEPAFKTQGRIIYTSFPCGMVRLAYKAIPVDEDGFPLLIDNETYLGALEAYIKKQVFTVKFDTGKISAGVLQNTQTDYAMLSRELATEFTQPSVSEMESYTRYYTSLLPRVREFDNGFKNLGDREYIRRH